jgi:hypothetical protein
VDEQPVARVTRADVERIVRRDFAVERQAEVFAALAEYGSAAWHNEADRVHAAALKLAGGDLEALRQAIVTAREDYRDVLAAAEYPLCMSVGTSPLGMPTEERRRVYAQDWAQYEAWLRRE